ncbi:MAG: class I SAM-dependent methyltransferase [Actinomycetota bacterium]|nr:class I SAM-dependent methyltransferase [Actinomycetota bacterium]
MPSITELRSFHRRRIAIPVRPGDLVLDVGSGDKPHWRADVLLDRFPDDEHSVQRSGAAAARTPRPLFDADAGAMPFADKVFDYVICSHVLEHVLDPGAAMSEMMRVGKAGYIELPVASSARILDFPSHLWWCSVHVDADGDDVLTFDAKTALSFHGEIDGWARSEPVHADLQKLFAKHLTSRLITFSWTDSFRFDVRGAPTAELLADVEKLGEQHHPREDIGVRLLTKLLTLPRWRERRPRQLRMSDVLRPELVPAGDPVLESRRYTLD